MKPLIYKPPKIEEKLKSTISEPIKLAKEFGEDHPFEFNELEKVYSKIGIASAIIDKHLDFIISPGFYVVSEEKKAEVIINRFIKETNFANILRELIREALTKGNGFLEIAQSGDQIELKVVNANNVYVRRKNTGEVVGYSQVLKKSDKFNHKNQIPFSPDEMIHLPINRMAGAAYGMGILLPGLATIDNLIKAEKAMHTLADRKSNSPIHAKIGSKEEPATQNEVSTFGRELEYLNNMHEWTTDHRVEFKVVDFGNLADKLTSVLEHDKEMIFFAFQIPGVLMGMANIPEGLANSQKMTFQRRIESLQSEIEKVVEKEIFQRILKMNGLKADVELEWGSPDETEINNRLDRLTAILSNPFISPITRTAMEKEILNLLKFEDEAKKLPKPDMSDERDREENDIEQPEIPGEKPNAQQSWKKIKEEVSTNEKAITVKEWLNFEYDRYLEEVLAFILKDDFTELRGRNKVDYALGKLNKTEIEQLKNILVTNFEKNATINDIAEDISKLNLKDRFTIDSDGNKKLVLSKEQRPIMIARSEVTRVASEGVLNHYDKKQVQEVRFLASISDRTCAQCLTLNGKVYNINEARGIIPVHTACRCAWIAL